MSMRIIKLIEMLELDMQTAVQFDKELEETTVEAFTLMLATANKYEGELKIKYIIALAKYISDNASGLFDQIEEKLGDGPRQSQSNQPS